MNSALTLRYLCAGLAPVLCGLAAPAAARAGGMSPDLQRQAAAYSRSTARKRVIVRFTAPNVDANRLAQSFGASGTVRLPSVHGAAMSVPYRALR